MNRKIVVVLLAILVILGVLGFVFKDELLNFFSKPSFPLADSQDSKEEQKEEFHFEWTEWQDSAGFSFKYPEDIEIDSHPEDETNYARLELIKSDRKGRIIIAVNDAEYGDIDEWLEKDELVKDGSGLGTEVASMSAKKVALEDGREIAAFIDWDQVIYVVDSQTEKEDYWKEVYAKILSSFKLIPLEGESEEDFSDWLAGFETSGVDIIEPIEMIE